MKERYKKDWSDWVMEIVFVLVFAFGLLVAANGLGLLIGVFYYFGK